MFETIIFNKTSLGLCDQLDSNYSILLTELMTQKTNLEKKTIKLNLEIQLVEIENKYNSLVQTSIGFGWLAIIFIISLFLIMILTDVIKKCLKTQKNYQ